MHRIFVYGTLKRGQPNHYLIANAANGVARYIGEGRTVQKWPLVIYSQYSVPFLLNVPGTGHQIRGDLFEVDDSMLSVLDDLEGHPHLYERSPIEVEIIKRMENSTAEVENSTPENSVGKCESYILKDFVEDMNEAPMYECYDAQVQLGYVIPSKRQVHVSMKDVVKKQNP